VRRFVISLVAALAAAAVAAAHVSADTSVQTFSDATGDSGTAVDITGVTVTNDETGRYRFDITFGGVFDNPAELDLYLDTDSNPKTGDPSYVGADYIVADYQDSHTYDFFKWDGTKWAETQNFAPIQVSVGAARKDLEVDLNKSDLDNTTSFNFWVATYRLDSNKDSDTAPAAAATWAYTFQNTLRLRAAGARATAAKAGGQWTLFLLATRSDTGAFVHEGSIICSAGAGSLKLKLVARAFVTPTGEIGTAASCTFAVPKKAKHKALTGHLTLSYLDSALSQTFKTTAK
jgi:hypothetical protein